MTFDDHLFAAVCDRLIRDVRMAAHPEGGWGYWLDPEAAAIYAAKVALQEARRLGKYPTTEELERECRRAA